MSRWQSVTRGTPVTVARRSLLGVSRPRSHPLAVLLGELVDVAQAVERHQTAGAGAADPVDREQQVAALPPPDQCGVYLEDLGGLGRGDVAVGILGHTRRRRIRS